MGSIPRKEKPLSAVNIAFSPGFGVAAAVGDFFQLFPMMDAGFESKEGSFGEKGSSLGEDSL